MDMIGTAKLPFFTALWQGARLDWSMTQSTVVGLFMLVKESIQGKGGLALQSVTGRLECWYCQ